MMKEKKGFSILEQVVWVRQHIDEYIENEEQLTVEHERIIEDLIRYADNIYTYPNEAVSAYMKFKKCFNNNPYVCMSGYVDQEQEWLSLHSLDQYWITENGQEVPIGMLVENETQEKRIQKYSQFMRDKLKDFKGKYIKNWTKEIQDVENKLLDINIRFVGKEDSLGIHATGIILVVIMWIIFIFSTFPALSSIEEYNYQFASRCIFLLQVACIWCSITMIISIINCFRLRKFRKITNNMDEFRKAIQYFIQNRCTETFADNLVKQNGNSLVEMRIPWEAFNNVTHYANKVSNKKRKIYTASLYTIVFLVVVIIVQFRCQKECLDISRKGQAAQEYQDVVEQIPTPSPTPTPKKEPSIFTDSGFLFSDSYIRELSREEIMALQDCEDYDFQTLLGFARNEIYARKGFLFKEGGKYYNHYIQYGWYQNMDYCEITEEMINEYERKNIDLIIEIEKEFGYR